MRAGHSMTLVGTKLYIIGGSYGQDYLKDVYELDTDPEPDWDFTHTAKPRLGAAIQDMVNNAQFSDVTFMVENRPFYAHKVIVAQLSEKFRAMFSTGMRESSGAGGPVVVPIQNISYTVFGQIMHFLYTGDFVMDQEGVASSLDKIIEVLGVADAEFLDDIKMLCEQRLISHLNTDNFSIMCHYADIYNANRLKEYCAWFHRVHPSVDSQIED
jgi:BTB/POZ domain-containing protein 11